MAAGLAARVVFGDDVFEVGEVGDRNGGGEEEAEENGEEIGTGEEVSAAGGGEFGES